MQDINAELRLLVVADIRLYRDGLAQVLNREQGITVVGTASDSDDALAQVRAIEPDVLLLDMGIPGSLATTRLIVESGSTRVIGLGVAEVEQDVIACAEAGVVGYVPRDASVADLIRSIWSVERGELLCSPRVAATLFRRAARRVSSGENGLPGRSLTARELEIVQLLDGGLSNKEIARRVGIEVGTVKNHVHNILEKLNVRRRGEAAARMRGSLHSHRSLHV